MTTPGSSQEREAPGDSSTQNPFESDFLGSTVIHLDEALQRVREIERLKQEKMEQGETVEKKPAAVAVGGDDGASDNLAELNAQKLDGKIRQIVNKVRSESSAALPRLLYLPGCLLLFRTTRSCGAHLSK